MSTTLPRTWPVSTSRWASAALASGKLRQIETRSAPAAASPAHPSSVAAYADREIVLRDGTVDETGLGLRAVPAGRAVHR